MPVSVSAKRTQAMILCPDPLLPKTISCPIYTFTNEGLAYKRSKVNVVFTCYLIMNLSSFFTFCCSLISSIENLGFYMT